MGFLADLGMNAANSLVGGAINYGIGELTSNSNMRRQRELMRESDAYQRQLISDLPSLNKSAMQSAGLSTSMLDGAFQSAATNAASTSPAANSATAPYDSTFATSVLTNKNLKKQNELLDNQVKAAQEDVKTKEYSNKVLKAETDDKLAIMKLRALKSRSTFEEQPQDGDVVVTASAKDDYMSDERYQLLHGLYESDYKAKELETTLRQNKARFENDITVAQFLDKDVRDAFINAPLQAYKQAVENVRKLRNDNHFFENVRKYREEVEKYGPRSAYLGIISSLTDIQGKQLANYLSKVLMPFTIQNTRTDTTNKTNDSKNSYNNILEKVLNGNGDWKDAVRVGMPIVKSLLGSLF